MTWKEDLVSALRGRGLTVCEAGGWKDFGVSDWTYGIPKAHLLHQFVIPYSEPDSNGVSMLTHGYDTGSYFLNPPVANMYLGKTGTVYMIAGRVAQHAGQGVRRVFDNAIADRPPSGDGQNAPCGDDWSGGSCAYLGTESHYPGGTQPYRQYEQAVLQGAALCDAFGWTPNRCLEHSNHTLRKTVDLLAIDGPQYRRDIQTVLNNGSGCVSSNAPAQSWLDSFMHWSSA